MQSTNVVIQPGGNSAKGELDGARRLEPPLHLAIRSTWWTHTHPGPLFDPLIQGRQEPLCITPALITLHRTAPALHRTAHTRRNAALTRAEKKSHSPVVPLHFGAPHRQQLRLATPPRHPYSRLQGLYSADQRRQRCLLHHVPVPSLRSQGAQHSTPHPASSSGLPWHPRMPPGSRASTL